MSNEISVQSRIFSKGETASGQHECYVVGEKWKALSGKRTYNLNISCFFIMDQIHKGEILAIYCPTNDIIVDIMTKPLQGSKLK